MWNGLPVIRREIAESMINNFGLSQKEAAEKLGITPAAVCQYISKKRGRLEITNEDVLEEIKASAERIINNGNDNVIPETCRICKMFRSTDEFSFLCPACNDD
jgi:predicted transcriptional regulator